MIEGCFFSLRKINIKPVPFIYTIAKISLVFRINHSIDMIKAERKHTILHDEVTNITLRCTCAI